PNRHLPSHDVVPKRRNERDYELRVVAHLGVGGASRRTANTGELPEMGLATIMMIGLTPDLDERPAREDIVIVPRVAILDGLAHHTDQSIMHHVVEGLEFEVRDLPHVEHDSQAKEQAAKAGASIAGVGKQDDRWQTHQVTADPAVREREERFAHPLQ